MDAKTIIAEHAAAPLAPPAPASALANIEAHVSTFVANVRAELVAADARSKTETAQLIVAARADGAKVATDAHAALDAAKAKVAEVEALAHTASPAATAPTAVSAAAPAAPAAGGIRSFIKAHRGEILAIVGLAGACVAAWHYLA